MTGRWPTAVFADLFERPLRNGLTRPKAVRGLGVKMVNMGELFAHDRIRGIDMERVPLSDREAQDYLLAPGDLLFARQSLVLSGAGKCSVSLGADARSTGTKMSRTSWHDMHSYAVPMPSQALAAALAETTRPMIERITANVHESHALAEVRDSLLPRLLSGTMRVS